MIKIISFVLLTVILVIGLTEIVFYISSFILKPKERVKSKYIVELYGKNPEQQIMWVQFIYRWFGKKFFSKIIFLTDFLEKDVSQHLENMYKSEVADFKNGVDYGKQERHL